MIPEAIWAMNRLNSWLRSGTYGWNSPHHAIYFLKRQAIEWAHQNVGCLHSTVITKVTCRGCGGTGKYCDSYGEMWPHCRACSSRGTLALRFVQSAIREGPVWHTPRNKFYLRNCPSPPYELARWTDGEWSVNQKGKEMTITEVARDLNTIETFWPDGWENAYNCSDYGTFYHFNYLLYLGRTDKCAFCGDSQTDGCGYCVSRELVNWTDHCCKACAARFKANGEDVFKKFEIPPEFIKHPEIIRWIDRHTSIKAHIKAKLKQWGEWD